MTKHTPTPWCYAFGAIYQGDDANTVEEHTGRLLQADRDNPHTQPTERDANCAFVVRAVNSHQELLAVVEWLADMNNTFSTVGIPGLAEAKHAARAALARAEGKEARS